MFSNDIIEQFLLRLPLKSVFRFKCVSKAWNSLISEPYFKHNFQLQSQGVGVNACGYFYYDCNEDDDPTGPARFLNIRDRGDQHMSDSFDFMDTFGLVVASCKGLLLLVTPPNWGVNPRYYYVCDPITRKYFPLPPTLGKYTFVAHGFLCEEGGNYTVVACTDACFLCRPVVEIETYSSKTGQWEKSVVAIASEFCLGPNPVAQVMGKGLYWWELYKTRLLAYDPNDPKQHGKIIEFPPYELRAYYSHEISETKEGYLQYSRAEYYIEIFVLNESTTTLFNTEEVIGQQRWNLIHKIDIFNHLNICLPDNVVVFGFNPLDPQGLLLYLHTATDKLILSYDYSNEKIDQICTFDLSSHTKLVFYQHPFWPFLC